MTGGGNDLGLGIGVLLALEGDLSGIGADAIDLASGLGGHSVGDGGCHVLHVSGVVAAGKGGRSGEIIVPLPHRGAISMAGGRNGLGLGVGVVLALEGDLGGVGPYAVGLAGGLGGHLVGNSSVHLLHMGIIIAASKGGRSGEIIVPLPHRLAVSMAGGRNGLGLGIGVLLALEGDLGGVGPHAVGLAGGRSGHLIGDGCVHRLHVRGIIAASKGGRSGEIIVPLPHRGAIGMAGGGDSQLLHRRLGLALGIAEQLAADGALPVSFHAGGLAGSRNLLHSGQLVAHRGIGQIRQSGIHIGLRDVQSGQHVHSGVIGLGQAVLLQIVGVRLDLGVDGRHTAGQGVLVGHLVIAGTSARTHGIAPTDVGAEGQRELHTHHVALGQIGIGKAHVGEYVLQAVHPAGAAGVVELAQTGLVRPGLDIEALLLQLLPQGLRDAVAGGINARQRIALDVGQIEAALQRAGVVVSEALLLQQTGQRLSGVLALDDVHIAGLDDVAAAQRQGLHGEHSLAHHITGLGLHIGDGIGYRGLVGLDNDGVLAFLGKVQGIAGLGVIVPVDGHRITVEEHRYLIGGQLVAVAVLGKDVEGHAGVALGDAILQRGLQRDDVLPYRHLKGGGELTEGHGDGLLPHGLQQSGGEGVLARGQGRGAVLGDSLHHQTGGIQRVALGINGFLGQSLDLNGSDQRQLHIHGLILTAHHGQGTLSGQIALLGDYIAPLAAGQRAGGGGSGGVDGDGIVAAVGQLDGAAVDGVSGVILHGEGDVRRIGLDHRDGDIRQGAQRKAAVAVGNVGGEIGQGIAVRADILAVAVKVENAVRQDIGLISIPVGGDLYLHGAAVVAVRPVEEVTLEEVLIAGDGIIAAGIGVRDVGVEAIQVRHGVGGVIHAGELHGDGVAGQDITGGVGLVGDDYPGLLCGDDLIGVGAILADLDDVFALGESQSHVAALGGHAVGAEAAGVGHGRLGEGGAQQGNGAAGGGPEGVLAAVIAGVVQHVCLGIQLVTGDLPVTVVDGHVGIRASGGVLAYLHHHHAGVFRPDGAKGLVLVDGPAGIRYIHGVIGHQNNGRTGAVGGDAAAVIHADHIGAVHIQCRVVEHRLQRRASHAGAAVVGDLEHTQGAQLLHAAHGQGDAAGVVHTVEADIRCVTLLVPENGLGIAGHGFRQVISGGGTGGFEHTGVSDKPIAGGPVDVAAAGYQPEGVDIAVVTGEIGIAGNQRTLPIGGGGNVGHNDMSALGDHEVGVYDLGRGGAPQGGA